MAKMWSWVEFVRPSKSRLMERRKSPHVELVATADLVFFDDEDGW